MKAVLILKGNAKIPDGEKLKRAGVKRCYYEAIDPQVDSAFFRDLRSWGFEAGVMWVPNWYGDPSPTQFIAQVNQDIDRLAPRNPQTGKRPPLSAMLDIEVHSESYVYDSLTLFNTVHPGRNLCWTCEFHQAGWFSKRLVDFINGDAQTKVAPQCYYGDMNHAVSDHAAARDLYTPHGGINDSRICFFYTLRVPLPLEWDGILYLESWSQLP